MPDIDVEIQRRVLADGSVVCRASRYARVEELPERDEKRVVAAVHQCQDTPSTPEYTSSFPDLTGRYEGKHWMLCLNQAGFHVEAWLSPKLSGNSTANRTVIRCSGKFDEGIGKFTLEGDRSLELIDSGGAPQSVSVEFSDGSIDVLERFSARATLSDRMVRGLRTAAKGELAAAAELVNAEHLPLPPSRTSLISKVLFAEELRARIQTVFRHEPIAANRVDIQNAIKHVERYFFALEPDGSLGGPRSSNWFDRTFPKADRGKIKALARGLCHCRSWTFASHNDVMTELTVYEWLQRLDMWDESYSTIRRAKLPLIRWIGIEPEKPHKYHLNLHAVGWSLGAGIPFTENLKKKLGGKLDEAFDKIGDIFIKEAAKKAIDKVLAKIDQSAGVKRLTGTLIVTNAESGWTKAYPVDFAYAMVGSGAAFFNYNKEIVAEGWCQTETEWLPDHFPGDLTVFTGVGATWDSKRAENQFVWTARGSGPNRGTHLVFDKVKSDMGSDFVGHGFGQIGPLEVETWRPPQYESRFRTEVYEEQLHTEESFHFHLGSATVRDRARSLLRKMCANELAELRDADSLLRVWGYADRLGRRWYNKELSQSRAENALQAVKDCVGPKLSAKTETYGAGEDGLAVLNKFMDFPDNAATPEMRKVVIWLNASARVELKVRDRKK